MSNLPKLPEPTIAGSMLTTKSGVFGGMYTAAQMLQFQRETLEACAKVCENLPKKFRTEFSKVSVECADAIRSLK